MKSREKTVPGTITKSGGLQMFMGELNEFFKQHPGCQVIANFKVLAKSPSEALKGYYFNYVVPEMKQAIWSVGGERKTDEQTDIFLRQLSPVTINQVVDLKSGKYENSIKEIYDLSSPELVEHIEFIKQIAAEEYGAFIDDPKPL